MQGALARSLRLDALLRIVVFQGCLSHDRGHGWCSTFVRTRPRQTTATLHEGHRGKGSGIQVLSQRTDRIAEHLGLRCNVDDSVPTAAETAPPFLVRA